MRTSTLLIGTGLLAGIGILVLAILQPWLTYEYFFSDPSSITHTNPLFGIGSTIVAMFWFSSGMICLFGSTLIHGQKKAFLICAALLTFLLSLDEILRFHDYVSPQLLGLGEREPKMIYVLLTFIYLIIFRKIIANSAWFVLVCSGIFFVASLAIDNSFIREQVIISYLPFIQNDANSEILEFLIEDSLKTTGIFLWILFHAQTTRILIRHETQNSIRKFKMHSSNLRFPESQVDSFASNHQKKAVTS